jgi:hypothetical protein
MKGNMKTLLDMLKASEVAGKCHKKNRNCTGSLDLLTLPPPQQRKMRIFTSRHSNQSDSNDSSMNDCSSSESDNEKRHVKHNRTTY